MDTDATALEQALGVLQNQFGGQLKESQRGGQAAMRTALQQQMGVGELDADRLVKKLCETGRLVYTGGAGTESGPVMTTGPLGTVVGSTTAQGVGPVVVPLAPAVTLGAANNPQGMAAPVLGAAVESEEDLESGGGARSVDARQAAENRSGATMGQLADTNVEGPARGPETLGDRQNRADDSGEGYWRIG